MDLTFFLLKVLRNASIGFLASTVSDLASNFLRVVKIYKQAQGSNDILSYRDIVGILLSEGALSSFIGRGMFTRLISNGIQSVVFTILWKLFVL